MLVRFLTTALLALVASIDAKATPLDDSHKDLLAAARKVLGGNSDNRLLKYGPKKGGSDKKPKSGKSPKGKSPKGKGKGGGDDNRYSGINAERLFYPTISENPFINEEFLGKDPFAKSPCTFTTFIIAGIIPNGMSAMGDMDPNAPGARFLYMSGVLNSGGIAAVINGVCTRTKANNGGAGGGGVCDWTVSAHFWSLTIQGYLDNGGGELVGTGGTDQLRGAIGQYNVTAATTDGEPWPGDVFEAPVFFITAQIGMTVCEG